MEILTLKYGESVLPESMIFEGGDKNAVRPITFTVYLVRTDSQNILIDAGCVTMPGFEMKNFIGPIKALESVGLSPDDITDLVITHAHHDHAECAEYYKNANVFIQRDEYEKASKYLGESTKIHLFDNEVKIADGVRAIKIGGHSKGSCIVEICDNGTIYVVTGDECYLKECIKKRIPTGASKNRDASRAFVEKYCDEKYKLLFCHDSDRN